MTYVFEIAILAEELSTVSAKAPLSEFARGRALP